MARQPLIITRALCITIFLFALFVAAGSAQSGEEKKTTEHPIEERAVPPNRPLGDGGERAQKGRPVDINPAARVNGVAISRAELDRSFDAFIQQRGMDTRMITDPSRYAQVQSEVLNGLINRELLWQEAKKMGLVANDAAVSEAIMDTKSRFSSEEEFNMRLAQRGISEEDYAEFLRQQLSVGNLVREVIAEEISVSDGEVRGYYEANPEQFRTPEQVRARHILVKVEPGADEAIRGEAKAKIDSILAETKSGADFAGLARKHSEGPSGPKGGDLGFFSREQMVKPFSEAAFALKPGEISDVVQTRFGYHIIRVEERKVPSTIPLKEVKEQIRKFLYAGKVQKAVQDRVDALREEGNVEILVGQ